MHKLTNWTARRSGPALTVTGTGETGAPFKMSGLDVVTVDESPHVIATEGGFRAHRAGHGEPVRLHLVTPAETALTGVVRELVFGDGTESSLQRAIGLCVAAQRRFGIERA
jgi:hypothetical protein